MRVAGNIQMVAGFIEVFKFKNHWYYIDIILAEIDVRLDSIAHPNGGGPADIFGKYFAQIFIIQLNRNARRGKNFGNFIQNLPRS